jgi:hypothetical protein
METSHFGNMETSQLFEKLERLRNRVSSFDESPEDLEGLNSQNSRPSRIFSVILAYLSQPDETGFSRVRNSKPGRCSSPKSLPLSHESLLSVSDQPVRTLNHARFQVATVDCVMSRADAQFAEIPPNSLASLVL